MIEGRFNLHGDRIEILSAPSWTKSVLASLRDSVKDAKEKVESIPDNQLEGALQELISKISEQDEKLSRFIEQQTQFNDDMASRLAASDNAAVAAKRRAKISALLSFLTAFLMWAVPASDVVNFTSTEIQPVFNQLYDQYLAGQ